jgi:threonine dehydrogenase-like Zn-dependent dehydrogenase
MEASAPPSSVSRSFRVTSLAGTYARTYLNSDLGEARSSLLIQIDLANDANGVSRVTAICARTLNSSAHPHLTARWRSSWVVLAGIPDGDIYTLSGSEARRRGLKTKFVRRMGDDFPRAIDLVSSGGVNVRALVTHRESLNAAPELFEALAQNRPGYLKALLYPNGDGPAKMTAL